MRGASRLPWKEASVEAVNAVAYATRRKSVRRTEQNGLLGAEVTALKEKP